MATPSNLTSLEVFEIPDELNPKLPLAADDVSLSFRLGFRTKTMWWLLLKPGAAYKRFGIKKANGKTRLIHAPSPAMRALLNSLRRRFVSPLADELPAYVTAYRPGKGIRDAVSHHIHACAVCDTHDKPHTCTVSYESNESNYRVVKRGACTACSPIPKHACARRGVKVHMDLKDFFHNTRAAWIRDLYREQGYSHRVAGYLASLMTTRITMDGSKGQYVMRGAPQGAPTSGDICNLVAHDRLDQHLVAALKGTGWVYTRYADDLYFSRPDNADRDVVDGLITQVRTIVRNAGWRVNTSKTQIQRPGRMQKHLGVCINQKPNIPRDQYKRVRAIVNDCWHRGFEAVATEKTVSGDALFRKLQGQINWFSNINPMKAEKLRLVLEAAREKHSGQP